MNIPGRKSVPKIAIVFIAELSFLLSIAIVRLTALSSLLACAIVVESLAREILTVASFCAMNW